MGSKTITLGAGATLLLPALVLIGVATLVAPTAAGSAGCLFTTNNPTATSLEVAGTIPNSLTTQTAHGHTVTLDQHQLQRAAAIVAVGKNENVPARGQLVALIAALTESGLRVLSNTGTYPTSASLPHDANNGADHDSLGLFQQRPASGWGSVTHLMDPVWSARAFYGGPDGPNHGSPRGLLDIQGWQIKTPSAAAQAVEVSAYPDRYATNQPVATKILSALTGVALDTGHCATSGNVPANLPPGFAGAFIAAATKKIGTPYVWGGGSFTGATGGGFDCSGLVLYAAYQASRGRIRLPHYTGDQIHQGRAVPWAGKQPGDLIFFSYPGAGGPHHVAIYLGGNRILQAPHTGDHVRYGTTSEFTGQVMTVRRLG